jgi:hypothetical protein
MARGDQIYVMQEFMNLHGLYEHHGIDCGDGSVIHYRKGTEVIERTPIDTFMLGESTFYVKDYSTSFTPDVVIHRAETRLGERNYNLIFNNCEHFATWCKTGVSHSSQVQDFIPFINQVNPQQLFEPIAQSLNRSKRPDALQLLDQALADIKVIWDDSQPKYQQATQDLKSWDKVAKEAVKRGRDDLARAAIAQKLIAQKRATELKSQLEHLASMTQTLIRNHQQLDLK